MAIPCNNSNLGRSCWKMMQLTTIYTAANIRWGLTEDYLCGSVVEYFPGVWKVNGQMTDWCSTY